MIHKTDKTRLVKSLARDIGFDRVGVTTAQPVNRVRYLRDWLADGRAGTMNYLHRNNHLREDPGQLFPSAKSVIVAAVNYHQPCDEPPAGASDPRGRVAMYAWGRDYHIVVKDMLKELITRMHDAIDEEFRARPCVDTVPILERELAERAGVGWIGKNTLVLHEDLGSYFFLGEIVTSLELEPDAPVTDHCGSCTACLDACPTDAFPAPYEMDASRCISYLTIEHRTDITDEFHGQIGDWIFGCDICQQVCPFNRRAPMSTVFTQEGMDPMPRLRDVLEWDEQTHAEQTRDSATNRATLDMFHRNAAIALNNAARQSDEPRI